MTKRAVGLVAALISTTWCHSAPAQSFVCHPSAGRPESEVILPVRDRNSPSLPGEAATIVEGETLCLTGVVLDDGEVDKLRLARDGDTDALIGISRSMGPVPVLEVWHAGAQPLQYSVIRMPHQGFAFPVREATVPAGTPAELTLERGLGSLAVTSFRFDRPGPAPHIERQPLRRRARWFAAPRRTGLYVVTGARWLDLPGVDAALAASGYPSLPKTWPLYGLGIFSTYRSLRFGGEFATGWMSRHGPAGKASLQYADYYLSGGWNVVRLDVFDADVTISLGGSWLEMGQNDASVAAPPDSGRMTAHRWMVGLDHGAGHLVHVRKNSELCVAWGYRIGYLHELAGAGWSRGEHQDAPVPDVNLSGVRGRIWIGFVSP